MAAVGLESELEAALVSDLGLTDLVADLGPSDLEAVDLEARPSDLE